MANNNAGMSSQLHRTDSDQEILDEARTEAKKMIKEKLGAFYNWGVPLVDASMALSFFFKMKHHQVSLTSPSTIMYLACLVLSFLTDMGMNMITQEFTWRWMMAYLSTILQISAATALMLFFNTTGIVTIIPVFCLVLVLIIRLFYQMLDPKKEPGYRWREQDFKESLNRGFEMSALVVAPSVAGLSGKVLGYVEVEGSASNLTAGGHGLTAVAPECFLFYSAVCGLLVVLLCTVPPSLGSTEDVKDMANVYIPGIANMALLFLVVATVVAAEKILQEYLYLVCYPITILAVFLCLCDIRNRQAARRSSLDDDRQDEAKVSKYLFKAGISSMLLAIMAIHSIYGGIGSTVSPSWSWKAFVFSALCSILSYTVRIFILGRITEEKRYEISMNFWTKGTFLTIITTAVFAVLVIWLHPDELINIF